MIENLVKIKFNILALKWEIMLVCLSKVFAVIIVVLIVCFVWWILDEMNKRR